LKKLRPAFEFIEGRVFFTITDIHSLKRDVRQTARNKMTLWLAKVEAVKARLDLSSTDAFIL
jgi:hypothetical protein